MSSRLSPPAASSTATGVTGLTGSGTATWCVEYASTRGVPPSLADPGPPLPALRNVPETYAALKRVNGSVPNLR